MLCCFLGRINVTLFNLPFEIGENWQVLSKIAAFSQDIDMKINSAPEALQIPRQSGEIQEATYKKRCDWSMDLATSRDI